MLNFGKYKNTKFYEFQNINSLDKDKINYCNWIKTIDITKSNQNKNMIDFQQFLKEDETKDYINAYNAKFDC